MRDDRREMEVGIESAISLYHEVHVEKRERNIKRETERRKLSDQKRRGANRGYRTRPLETNVVRKFS